MNRDQYRLINDHPLRHLLHSVTNPRAALPGRQELSDRIVEALPNAPAKVHDKVFKVAVQLAEAANSGENGARWHARGRADDEALAVLEKLQQQDQLLPPEQPSELPDHAARRVAYRERGLDDAQTEQALADDAERQRLAQLGVRTDG